MIQKSSRVSPENRRSGASPALARLRRTFPGQVLTDEGSRFRASLDNLRLSFPPEAVLKVANATDVGAALALANRYEVPVTARGAGSSATGSAAPVRGGWVLDLSGLDSVRIDRVSRIASVGPGTLTAALQKKAEKVGLFYPPDPSSKAYATIGGNIACNAGGMRCVKYGVTRDYVLGLEGYLADGAEVRWGLPLKKFVSGFNLRDLWVGAEGMLGVVTAAHLRLLPKPPARWTGMFAFKSEAAALRSVTAALRHGFNPSIVEFLDCQSVSCAEAYTGKPVFEGQEGAALLLIELDGTAAEVASERERLRTLMEARASATREAENAAEAEDIWQVRRTCSQSMFALADTKLNEDVVVPLTKQVELVEYARRLKREIGLPTPTFGHAGDGNLHVHIMYHRASSEEASRAKVGIRRLMEKVVELGGSITGEHGIGLAKVPFLQLQHNPAEIAAMQRVKAALDPKGILNPGKMFEPFEVWDHEPVDVRMPWDHLPKNG